jgi:FkbM family methyltransferase
MYCSRVVHIAKVKHKLKLLYEVSPIEVIRKHFHGDLSVIHVGSHLAQEKAIYEMARIKNYLWIEANPLIFQQLEKRVGHSNCSQTLVWSKCGVELEFKLASNEVSSSVFDFEKKNKMFSNLEMIRTINLKSRTLDCLLSYDFSSFKNLNFFLVVDIQGAEFEALQGFKEHLSLATAVLIEVSKKQIYKTNYNFKDLDLLLNLHGFRKLCDFTDIHTGHGDVLYFKETEISRRKIWLYSLTRSLRYLTWTIEILERRQKIRLI